MLYYEYFITLADEIRLIWQRRWSLATILFFLIRYGFLVDVTLIVLFSARVSETSGPALSAERCVWVHARGKIDKHIEQLSSDVYSCDKSAADELHHTFA